MLGHSFLVSPFIELCASTTHTYREGVTRLPKEMANARKRRGKRAKTEKKRAKPSNNQTKACRTPLSWGLDRERDDPSGLLAELVNREKPPVTTRNLETDDSLPLAKSDAANHCRFPGGCSDFRTRLYQHEQFAGFLQITR